MKNHIIGNILLSVIATVLAAYVLNKMQPKSGINTINTDDKAKYYNDMHDFISSSPYVNNYDLKNESGILF